MQYLTCSVTGQGSCEGSGQRLGSWDLALGKGRFAPTPVQQPAWRSHFTEQHTEALLDRRGFSSISQ